MGAFTYQTPLVFITEPQLCADRQPLLKQTPPFDSTLTWRHVIRTSPNIFASLLFIYPPPLSSRGRVQTQTQGKGLGMTVYQRFWLDSFFGGFLSPFLPILACGAVCISICYDEPWCQMVAFVCAHACVCTTRPLWRSLQLADMNILMITPANNCRHESSQQTCWKQSPPINLSSLWGRSVSPCFMYFYPCSPGVTVNTQLFHTLYNLVLEPKQHLLFCLFGGRGPMYERAASWKQKWAVVLTLIDMQYFSHAHQLI